MMGAAVQQSEAQEHLRSEVAASLETPVELLPVLPVLLQAVSSLSGAQDGVLALLRRTCLPRGAAVLDLVSLCTCSGGIWLLATLRKAVRLPLAQLVSCHDVP